MKQNRFLRFLSRIWIRLLAFNVLLVFLPAAGLVYLASYEEELLFSQEDAMAQEGRLLAATLSSSSAATPLQGQTEPPVPMAPQRNTQTSPEELEPTTAPQLDVAKAQHILEQLNRRSASRLRVVDLTGNVVADSVRRGPQRQGASDSLEDSSEPALRDDRIYRLGSWLYRLYERMLGRRELRGEPTDVGPKELLQRREIRKALDGEYGAASRPTPGQRSLTLHSALPIEQQGEVVGVVLVSRTTLRLLRSLYDMRLKIFRIFLASVAAAVVLSLLVGTTIAGPLRRLRQQAQELLDRRGRLRGRFRDSGKLDEIGDLARALEELTRRLAEHMSFIESFASDVSHEFKNPLASIRSAAETASDATDPKDQKRFLDIIQSQVARMEHLLTAARDLTHLDAQLEQEERTRVLLPQLLEDIVEGFRLRGTPGVDFRTTLDEGAIAVLAAPERLAQVFENLLENAVSYSPSGGEVHLSLKYSSPSIIVEITDEGEGIPEEHLEKIFTRFFSYRPGSTTDEHHHGLGLAVVKAIIDGYGGEVTAENHPSQGATFRIVLPEETSGVSP